MNVMKKICLFFLLLIFSTASADLEAHFLDVGHGDCTIITCDGEAMIIDGGNTGSSQLVLNYLKNNGITDLKYAVATHPDADHIGGLPAAFHAATVQTLLSPVETSDENRFNVLLNTAREKAVPLVVPEAGTVYGLGSAQVTVLSPVIKFADSNDISIVLRVDYGKTSMLLMADASTAVERDLIARQANLDADVLKVSHHGSDTATSTAFVAAVSPDIAVISCAENSGAPSWDVLYNLADKRILTTSQKGTIILRSDAETLTISSDEFSETVENTLYVGNIKSLVLHRASCEGVATMKDKNKTYFESKETAISKGYRPCDICDP